MQEGFRLPPVSMTNPDLALEFSRVSNSLSLKVDKWLCEAKRNVG